MFFKLQKSGVNFEKDKELKQLIVDSVDIQDFINFPEKVEFNIRPSAFEKDANSEIPLDNFTSSSSSKQNNKFFFKKMRIKTQDSSLMMNLEYEDLEKSKTVADKRKDRNKKIENKKKVLI